RPAEWRPPPHPAHRWLRRHAGLGPDRHARSQADWFSPWPPRPRTAAGAGNGRRSGVGATVFDVLFCWRSGSVPGPAIGSVDRGVSERLRESAFRTGQNRATEGSTQQTGEAPMNLEGKAGIVTGAGRGIGRGIALLMAKEGASVIVNDPGAGRNGEVTNERPADEVVEEIVKTGGKALANYDSVASYASAGRMVRQCADTFGKIDFVVNAAGMLRERMIWNMTEDDFDAVISVHLKGTWNMSHHAIKLMRGERFGRIVNFSSDAFKGSVGQCNYAAPKAGVSGLTRTIARECGRYGITANAMFP